MENNVINNINKNRQSLLIIFLSAFVFFAFSAKGSFEKASIDTPPAIITVGLHLSGSEKLPEEYYKELDIALKSKNIGDKIGVIKVVYLGNLDAVCDALKSGDIDIAGEISPIEYVRNYSNYEFKPFLGIEYNNKTHYQSVFFSVNDDRFNNKFKDDLGYDNLEIIKSLLKNKRTNAVLAVQSGDSTSGYYYPRSYMIDENINHRRTHKFKAHKDIFNHVLRISENNRFVGGFIADWRYKNYEKEITEKRGIYNSQYKYSTPFILDKSDPIPNGVFVMSKKFYKSTSGEEMERIRRVWKTIRKIQLKGGPLITGWRSGVEKDLGQVEYHKNKVDYYYLYKNNHTVYMAIFVAIVVIVMCAFSALYIRNVGKMQ